MRRRCNCERTQRQREGDRSANSGYSIFHHISPPPASACTTHSRHVHAYRTCRHRCCARARRRSRETGAAGVGAFERYRAGHRQRSRFSRRFVAWHRRLIARAHIFARVGRTNLSQVHGPLVHGDVSVLFASLVSGPDYIFAVRGVELGPSHRRDGVGSMHLVVRARAAPILH